MTWIADFAGARAPLWITLLAAAGCGGADAATTAAGATHRVGRGELHVTLTENGTLVAKESRQVSLTARRGGKIAWLVEAGKLVEEGEELCRLDGTDLESSIQQSELEVVQSEADLKNAQTELEIQTTEGQASVEKAQVTLEKARGDLERYREGEAPQERRKLLVAIKDAQTEFGRKKKFYEDSQVLVEQGYLKRSELEEHQIAFEKAQVQLEGAELDLQLFDRYKHPMDLKAKETAVSDAERDLVSAQKRAESQLLQKQVALTKAEKQLLRQRKRLQDYKEDLEKFTLRAPCKGIVLHGNPKQPWYNDNIKVGGEIWEGVTVCTIPDLSVMQARIQVHEADINKLKEGLTASVTMDSYPGLVLDGQVTRIANIANGTERGGGDAVKQFDVEVTVDQKQDLKLRPGVSAKVTIDIDRLPDVVTVPLQCVLLEGAEHACFVRAADGSIARRAVEPGASNDTAIEIKSGLQVGEEVLLYNPRLPASGDSPAPTQPAVDQGAQPAAAADASQQPH